MAEVLNPKGPALQLSPADDPEVADANADWLKLLDGGRHQAEDLAAHEYARRLHYQRQDREKGLATKEIDRYRQRLRFLVRGLWAGEMGVPEFLDLGAATVIRFTREAWARGAEAVGISEDELTAEELAARDEFIMGQLPHLYSFAQDITEHNRAGDYLLQRHDPRLELWVNRYNEAKMLAQTMAGANRKYRWELGATEEHCADCAAYAGRVHRGSVWQKYGALPRSRELDCGGWRCDCRLVETDEPALPGQPPRPSQIGEKELKHLAGQHDQKRHGWRYGGGVSLSKLRRQREAGGEAEWEEYKRRARGQPVATPQTNAESGRPPGENWQEDAKIAGRHVGLGPSAWGKSVDATHDAIAEATGLPRDAVRNQTQALTTTSNDTRKSSLELQEAIAEEFDAAELSEWQKTKIVAVDEERAKALARPKLTFSEQNELLSAFEDRFTGDKLEDVDDTKEAARKYAREMYNQTQADFAAAGISEVVVTRGVVLPRAVAEQMGILDAGVGGTVRWRGNALESWSSSDVQGAWYAERRSWSEIGVQLRMRVPVSRVFGTERQGFGFAQEDEYAILGGAFDDVAEIAYIAGGR